ncbi:HAD family hydrolase [Brevibacillus laterosporus]|uniref:Haloacid dehalogenase n=1 Tax=Brevibacillus laterosporus TaxID=1465 RepID=A0A0F7EGF8_BRELA|nr:haloacid dehalogenase [Brevibacillus laterosporus]
MSIQHAVIFDMDGTLLQTESMAIPGFRRTFQDLRDRHLWNGELPDDRAITSTLGRVLDEIWDEMLPEADEKTRELATELLAKHEEKLLDEGVVSLYPGVVEQLTALHEKGIALFVASNAMDGYVEAICEHFNITHLFTDLYSAGRFQTESKVDLVALLLKTYDVKQAVMVGDRKSDVEAGKKNHLWTIGCDFGFADSGELKNADVVIQGYAELLQQVPFYQSK